ncbi:MAG: 6,7-dimethyl-8-ribityllumazine synthase [Deltaproteobacteria bacterium]|nr:6,7-dimethyl-8-ribityllumazine synthase [Deltaproteobacteria bacterium]
MRLAIVMSRFNQPITERLLEGALAAIRDAGSDAEKIPVVKVPGAFELALTAKRLAVTRSFDAIVCLGAVIRGETPHFDYVCSEAARGIAEVSRETGIPVTFGVITADIAEQAAARSDPRGLNRGREAAEAAIEMVKVLRHIQKEIGS